jgi:hypothetical protein
LKRQLRKATEEGKRERQTRKESEQCSRERQPRKAAEEGTRERQPRIATMQGKRERQLRKAAEQGGRARQMKKAAEKGNRGRQTRKANEEGNRGWQLRKANENCKRGRQPRKAAEEGSRTRQPRKATEKGSRGRQPRKAAGEGSRERQPGKATEKSNIPRNRQHTARALRGAADPSALRAHPHPPTYPHASARAHTHAGFNTMRYKGMDSASGLGRTLSIIRLGATAVVAPYSVGSMPTKGQMKPNSRASLTASQARRTHTNAHASRPSARTARINHSRAGDKTRMRS